MASPSKEEHLLKLFLENSPFKQWHFEEIRKEAQVTRAIASKWLKKYVKEGLLKKVKEQGKFPFFVVGEHNPVYGAQKKMYQLEQFSKSGLLSYLLSLHEAKMIVLFGSTIRGDWYKDSDIDIFILGKVENFQKAHYELKLQRPIELHLFQERKEFKEIKSGLLKNVLNGYLVKGNMQNIIGANI